MKQNNIKINLRRILLIQYLAIRVRDLCSMMTNINYWVEIYTQGFL